VLFQVAARDADAVTRGDLLVLNGSSMAPGCRFRASPTFSEGKADGENDRARAPACVVVLDRPGAIVAELTYNHGAGTRTPDCDRRSSHTIEPGGPASRGPRLRAARSSVRFDSERDRFVVRSGGDWTEVIPSSTASQPCRLRLVLDRDRRADAQPIGYFPGFDVPGVTHWPRIVADGSCLREHWVFRKGEWPETSMRGDDILGFARAALSWRHRWLLPRHVFVHSSKEPKPRYVDLESGVFLDLLRRDLAALSGEDGGTLHVTEFFPGPADLFVRDASGGFATEFLVQMDDGPVRSAR
jgi:hypothetical protein